MKSLNKMRDVIITAILYTLIICFFMVLSGQTPVFSREPRPPAVEVTPDRWPRSAEVGGVKYTIYQPQLDSWDGYHFEAHAAVSVVPAKARQPLFGVIHVSAITHVDRLSRVVRLNDVEIAKSIFLSAPGKEARFRNGFRNMLSSGPLTASLDRMLAGLAAVGAEKSARAVPVKNEPPNFVFSRTAAALVSIDGSPAWRMLKGARLARVINTRALILRDESGKVYLHLFDGFLEAPALSGPWKVAGKAPVDAEQVAGKLAGERLVDLMEGVPDEKTRKKPSLRNGVPKVFTATTPTELIQTQGQADWVPIEGTTLQYVKNTTGNIFWSVNDQFIYVLVTGRWFRAREFTGPWQYVPGKDLPADFANIPDNSPKENVKASVPGTSQAREAVIAASIPHTARIDRWNTRFTPQISGNPELRPIPETMLNYVFNSPTPIIMVSPTEWYAVQSGVWFSASSLSGPWFVTTSVPAVIYSIPPSSPVFYATYVKVFEATPEYIVAGYTPGYMGTIVSRGGVVVYGTGYNYASYAGPTVWYGQPVTYGYAANPTWTPWTGWVMGFGMGWAFGAATSSYYCYTPAPYWGAMPYSPYTGYSYGPHGGAAAWGPGGWAATTVNAYQHWDPATVISRSPAGYNAWSGNAWSSKVGSSYNYVTGRLSAGQQAPVANVYTADRSAAAEKSGNNYFATRDGNVYRITGSGWEQYDNGGWKTMDMPTPESGASPNMDFLEAQRQARLVGDLRSAAAAWGSTSWGGGFSGQSGSGDGQRHRGGSRRGKQHRDAR